MHLKRFSQQLIIVILSLGSFTSCTSLPKMSFKGFMETFGFPQGTDEKKVNHVELEALVTIEKQVSERQYSEAFSAAKKFQQTYRNSEFFLWSRVIEGEALAGMEMHSEAIEVFKSVIVLSANVNDEIATYALFYQGKSFEALGDSENALVSYLDVLSRRDFLPDHIASIQMPLEIAQTYASLGLSNEFLEYSNKALVGLNPFMQSKKLSPRQKAQFLLRLGRMGPWQVRSSQYEQDFSRDQHRLTLILRAAQLNASPESTQATQYLIQTLKEYEQLVEQYEIPVEREQSMEALERRKSLALSLLDTLLNLNSTLNEEIPPGSPEQSVKNYLAESVERTKTLLETVIIRNPLTKESIHFRSDKKSILLKPSQFFPEEMNKKLSHPSKDPNL